MKRLPLLVLQGVLVFSFLAAIAESSKLLEELSEGFREPATTAFDAIGRIQLAKFEDDGYAARKLDAEKALDAARHKINSPKDQHAFDVLKATLDLRALTREDVKYGKSALQCTYESFLIFYPEKLKPDALEQAKKATCLAEYKKMLDRLEGKQ